MKHRFLRQHVFYNGTSLVVAKAGDHLPAPTAMLDDLILGGVIADPASTNPATITVGDHSAMYLPHGRYSLSGPGIDQPEIVEGDAEAVEARVAEIVAALPPRRRSRREETR